MLNEKKIKFFLIATIFTIVNIIYSWYSASIEVFLPRQTILLLYVGGLYTFNDELKEFIEEDSSINEKLRGKYSLLKTELILLLGAVIGLILFTTFSLSEDNYVLSYLGLVNMVLYLLVLWYKIFCIMITPEVRVYDQSRLSMREVKVLVQKGQIRKVVSAFIKQGAHFCKLCLNGGIGLVATVWLGPKVITGDILYRGQMMNDLCFPYTGYRVTSEVDASRFNYYIAHYPEDRASLLDAAGYVKSRQLDEQIAKKGLLDVGLKP